MTDREETLAAVTANLDETQMVSLQDLEELERLQIAGVSKNAPVLRPRRTLPLSALLGLVTALVLSVILAVAYLHSRTQPITVHAAAAGVR